MRKDFRLQTSDFRRPLSGGRSQFPTPSSESGEVRQTATANGYGKRPTADAERPTDYGLRYGVRRTAYGIRLHSRLACLPCSFRAVIPNRSLRVRMIESRKM